MPPHRGHAFHARHWTRTRSYLYLLDLGPVQDPLWRDRSGYCPVPLNLEAMRQAAAALPGLRDFSAFRASNCRARSPVRRMHRAQVLELDGMVALHFVANGFLQNMVRILAGTLVEIGKGRRPPGWMAQLLRSGERELAGRTAAGRGLHFLGPSYPAHCGLPPPPPPQACWSRAAAGAGAIADAGVATDAGTATEGTAVDAGAATDLGIAAGARRENGRPAAPDALGQDGQQVRQV